MYTHTAKDIAHLLSKDVERIARHLLPNGKRVGNEWCVGSVVGEPGQSLKICLTGPKAGLWCDFAQGNSQKGDLLDLWRICRSLEFREAILEAKGWLGIPAVKFEPQRRLNWKKPETKTSNPLSQISPVGCYLREARQLQTETLQKYQIQEESNQVIFPYYRDNELIMVKHLNLQRNNGKKQIYVTPGCEPCLFGWHAIPAGCRSLAITEGEIDAMTLFQYGLPVGVLSVPFGGGGGDKQKWVENEFDRLAEYDEIYLSMDQDPEGDAATQELVQRLGRHRCRIVVLPYKDANECLQKGVSEEEIRKCFENARTLDPEELKRASCFVEQVIEEIYPSSTQPVGYELPWNKTRGKIYFRSDELSVWTGINGHGKSQFIGQAILHAMKDNAKVCIASLELKPKRLLARLTRQTSGLRDPSIEYIRVIHQWYQDHLWIFDLVGTAKTDRLIEVFKYARQRYGVDVFVIDSFMKCGLPEDDYNAQKKFIEQLCDFKNEYNCHVHVIVHPRKGNDESKLPGKLDTKGSGSITDLADNCFTVWRNKHKEEEMKKCISQTPQTSEIFEKPDCILLCDKQRNGEWEGKIMLWFDQNSYQYLERQGQRPIQMVNYTKTMSQTSSFNQMEAATT